MTRRRSVPWLHRWSRFMIGAIAGLGALTTAYLTIEKLTGRTPACLASAGGQASSSCADVLSSPWATVFGLPLALFGFLAYASMAVFASSLFCFFSTDCRSLVSQRSSLKYTVLLLVTVGALYLPISDRFIAAQTASFQAQRFIQG